MNLTETQKAQLLRPINQVRVSKDAKGFSHLEAYEVRAHLSRIFGIGGWSQEVTDQQIVFETEGIKRDKNGDVVLDRHGNEIPVWTVCYRSLVRLTVPSDYDGVTYTEGATGDATNMPSRADAHDMALKTSQSQALKRCAVNLGDQFGLSLYNKGSLRPLVVRCLPWDDSTADATDHITTPLAPENGETEAPQREVSSPVPPAASPATVTEVEAEGTPAAVNDDWLAILAVLSVVGSQGPGEAMKTIKTLMEMAAKAGLTNRKLPDEDRTLGAKLQHLLRSASNAARQEVSP